MNGDQSLSRKKSIIKAYKQCMTPALYSKSLFSASKLTVNSLLYVKEQLALSAEYHLLCSTEEIKSYEFRTSWWVNDWLVKIVINKELICIYKIRPAFVFYERVYSRYSSSLSSSPSNMLYLNFQYTIPSIPMYTMSSSSSSSSSWPTSLS